MTYEFHPAAEAEFLESVGYYESHVPGLGGAFIDEFEALIDLICEAPNSGKLSANRISAEPHFAVSLFP
jgi:toxin ParE1/3/4